MPVALIASENTPRDASGANCGLPHDVQIAVHSKVIPVYYLWLKHGLADGSKGGVHWYEES